MRAFALSTKPTRKERVIDTMTTMGPAVMLGVAFTNLPGIICLHWAQGKFKNFLFYTNFVLFVQMFFLYVCAFLIFVLNLKSPNYRGFLFPHESGDYTVRHCSRSYLRAGDFGLFRPAREQGDSVSGTRGNATYANGYAFEGKRSE